MTQLFDTATYDDLDEIGVLSDAADTARHLRSMPTGERLPSRSNQWRLDDQTIEVGRKGIEAARQALQDAARANGGTTRTSTDKARKAA